MTDDEIRLDHDLAFGRAVQLTPRIRRITQNNPGLFSGPGTNTFLVGTEALFILEPGEEQPGGDSGEHFTAIVGAAGNTPVAGIIPTHHHRDHWPLAARLSAHFKAPTFGYEAIGGYAPDYEVCDGETLEAPGVTLEVLFTPGHASDHCCYLLHADPASASTGDSEGPSGQEIFTGDLVMGWSSSIIPPPDGNLNQYMASLKRVLELTPGIGYSAHGPTILDATNRTRELFEHRQDRTRQALEALASGPATIPEMVKVIYADVNPQLHGAAQYSLLAHLLALTETGEVKSKHDSPAEPGEAVATAMAALYSLT